MEALRFALLGLATGAVYALLAQGVVLVYRGSGLINFAQGALAMTGAYTYYQLSAVNQLPKAAAALIAVVLCAAIGALFHLFALRPMRRRNASPLSRVIATLSLLLVLQSGATLIYGSYPLTVASLLPTSTTPILGESLRIGVDRLWILVICLVTSAVLYAVYRWSSFGRVTAAVAENELAASSLGYSPDTVAAVNWAVGSALAGLAGVLIAPIIFLEPNGLVLLVIPAMAVALVGGFASFPVAVAAGLALGVVQAELTRYVGQQGWSTAAPFVVVIVYLVVRGHGLPLRSFVLDRLPAVGNGRVRPAVLVALLVIGVLVTGTVDADWNRAMVTTFAFGIICLSIVLLTGYAGQLSLAQFVIAGVGALTAARLSSHLPFVPSLILAGLVTGIVGALVGLPALRTRGVSLAVATLCLASGIVSVVFTNSGWTGGISGIPISSPTVLGWSIDPFLHPGRYAFVTFALMIGVAVALANVRRGRTGRRLLAVRSNEKAAASIGIAVAEVKAYAFFLAAVIAAIGGVMLVFVQPTVQMTQFDVFTCIVLVGVTVTAGVGYLPGGVLGATLVAGGILTLAFSGWSGFGLYLPLLGALLLLLTLMTAPDGSYAVARAMSANLLARVVRPPARSDSGSAPALAPAIGRVDARVLSVEGVSVAFGGVKAVQDVTFEIRPGEVHGLIGPNGAGKTTIIDAVTGFTRTTAGTVRLGGDDVSRWSPRRRAVHGLTRSFQSLELFDDMTVEENLAVASEGRHAWRYLTDMLVPGRVQLSAAAAAAVDGLQLEHLLAERPTSISFGQRKVVAIARCVASAPSVLLLDEPAAGLDDAEADELAALIRRLADEWGIGILLVEHKVDMIMSTCDRVTVLEGGRVIASGDPDRIRSTPEVVDAYLGVAPYPDAIPGRAPAPVSVAADS